MSQILENNFSGLTNEQIYKETLNRVVNFFNNDTAISADLLPSMISKSYLKSYNKPCERWSLRNNIIMLVVGQTADARTFNQWKAISRYVKKGEKAFYLVAPVLAEVEELNEKSGKMEKKLKFTGQFKKSVAFFSDFQTDGKPIEYVEKPKELPPLYDVAVSMGLKVQYDNTQIGEYGSFDPESQEIRLCTSDIGTFFHELAHAIHQKIAGSKLNMNRESQEYKTQEVIAELTSCVLAQIYGFDKRTYSMQYIKSYMDTDQKVGSEILKVIGTVQKILDNIFSMRREDA